MCVGGIWRFCDLVAYLFDIFQDALNRKTGHLVLHTCPDRYKNRNHHRN